MVEDKQVTSVPEREKNNVRVSGGRSRLVFADLTKHILHGGEKEVIISGLNYTISEAVAVAELLKDQGMVQVTKINTTQMPSSSASSPETIVDKMEITVVKSKNFDRLYDDLVKEREAKAAAKKLEANAANGGAATASS